MATPPARSSNVHLHARKAPRSDRRLVDNMTFRNAAIFGARRACAVHFARA
jgi:hypothetical protein